ncbi:signal peptidase I [Agromyces larvae]|uniref:Signal peptidase I n=1 Tax=Agromyces larvae TaxID=2929802 RepID=A0ABY4BV48_9MICO|nr:signal peptidase I [Agromyces larvae]UOE43054.1 signal peptidase I [Agromyces larvae]
MRIALSRALVTLVATLAVIAVVPQVFGLTATTVMSDSMAPVIRAGDVALSLPVEPDVIAEGQVVLFPDPSGADRLMLHRVADIDDDGMLRTKGDANESADSTLVDPADVVGVGVILVPLVGLPVVWAAAGAWWLVALVVIVMAVALRGMVRPVAEPDRRNRSPVRLALELTAAALTVVLGVVLVCAGVGRGASAAWTAQTATGVSTWEMARPPAAPCEITALDWSPWGGGPGGGNMSFNVNTSGSEVIPGGWELTWSFPGDQQITETDWVDSYTQTGHDVVWVGPAEKPIGPGDSANVGMRLYSQSGDWSQPPTDFRLNGTSCTVVHAEPAP